MSKQEFLRTAEPHFFRLPNGDKIGEIYIDTPKNQLPTLKRCLHRFMDLETYGDISIVYDNQHLNFLADYTTEILARGDMREIDRYITQIVKRSISALGVSFKNTESTPHTIKGLSLEEIQSARQIFRSAKNVPGREVIIFNPNAKDGQYIKDMTQSGDLIGKQKRIKIIEPGQTIILG